MKILFFLDSLVAGGKERRALELMKGLRLNLKIDLELVLMSKEIHYKEIYDLNIKIQYIIRSSKKDLTVFYKFYTICKLYRPDIVHCWDSMTAVIGVPACRLLNIILVNGMVVDTPVKQNIFNKHWLRAKLTFPFSNLVIGNSKSGLEAYGASRRKSLSIYNGMDFLRFKNLKDSESLRKEIFGDNYNNIFVAGMVAAFEERKDYATLIKAAILLIENNNNIRFVLVGDGANLNEIKKSVPPKLFNKIIFLGKRSDIESIINIFTVGILLTNSKVHGEGISNSIIEYMALGKPVIATRGGGTNEAIIDKENGYLIDAANISQLVEKIEILVANKKLVDNLGRKSNQIAKDKFDLKIMTDNYINAYQQLLKERKN